MKNVLLIDDDATDIFLGKKLLGFTGLVNEVYTSRNGRDALDLLKEFEEARQPMPDVILLDLNMPVMDGFGFLDEFNKLRHEAVSVIVLSSSDNPHDVVRAKQLGVDVFLHKPLQTEQLQAYLEVR